MRAERNRVTDIRIAYIGGGSRGWARTFMADLSGEPALEGTVALYDTDREAAQKNEIIGNRLSAKPETAGKWRYVVADSLGDAVSGADFIVISILPGTFDEMESDVHLPERHGIYQSVGDTAGPGGILRALRAIPMFAEIAEAVRRYAPDAWVINYTNPMSLCMLALYRVFPQIKAFGCCHEVFGTQKLLRDIYQEETGERDVGRDEVHVNVLGINHFTWFDSASCRGADLFPIYRKYAEKYYETGLSFQDEHWMNASFRSANRVKFDLFLRYGAIAAAGDRHLAEFMPGELYLKDPETVSRWMFGLTTVSWRKEEQAERLGRSDRLVSGELEMEIRPSGEEAVLQIKALCGLGRLITNVNVPNRFRQIGNLPESAMVETNVLLEKDSVRPLCAGMLSDPLLELIRPHVDNHELVLQAAMTCDSRPALRAFMTNPLVSGRISRSEGERLFRDMVRNTLAYLPKPWQETV